MTAMITNPPILLDLPMPIETERLVIRPPQPGDGEGLYTIIHETHDDLVRWLNWSTTLPTPQELEIESRQLWAKFILRHELRFILVEKASNRIVGRMAFPPILTKWFLPIFGISYFIGRSYQGLGYGFEGAHAITLYAFKVMNAKKVSIKCDKDNIKSRKIPERLGFELEGIERGTWQHPNTQTLTEIYNYCCFDPLNLPKLPVQWGRY